MRPTGRTRLLEVIDRHPEGIPKAAALREAGLPFRGIGRTYLNEMESAGLIIVEREHSASAVVKPIPAKKGKRK
jgi:hypothetical protein